MKKIIFIIILNLVIAITSKAQLNPINNFYFNHIYEMPYNCFDLSWSKPDTSLIDTLVGYKIYRNDSLYMFTTSLFHSCNPCIGAPIVSFCDFGYYNQGVFFIHVTAVYNSQHLESSYNDGADFGGMLIGINEYKSNKIVAISNVIQETSLLRIEINRNIESGELIISNSLGQTIKIIQLNDQNSIVTNVSNYNSGLYFLKLITNENCMTKKVLIK